MIRVEVVYAQPESQVLETLELARGACVRDAVHAARLLERFPEIELERDGAGIFGQRVNLDHMLTDGDRVEIYRPLKIQPMERRRRLAAARSGKGRK